MVSLKRADIMQPVQKDIHYYANGSLIDLAGCENHLGPCSVMYAQSSSRTPNSPGIEMLAQR